MTYPPLYSSLRNDLESKIRSGDLRPNQRIPSIRKMAIKTGVSEITVRRSVQELVNSGALYTRPGIGIFVAGPEYTSSVRSKRVALKHAIAIGRSPIQPGTASGSSYVRMMVGMREAASQRGIQLDYVRIKEINRHGGLISYLENVGAQGGTRAWLIVLIDWA